MPFHQAGDIKYYQFSSFENHGLYHAVFARQGGESPAPWKSLNFGASVGDHASNVKKNREKALALFGKKLDGVYDVYQVHSNDVVLTDKPLGSNEAHKKADAILTTTPEITLMMRFADCVPIFLFDSVQRVIGIVHAGWMGTVNRIIAKAITAMVDNYGSKPGNIFAGIGPSIGPDHYAVGEDVLEKVRASFSDKARLLISNKQGKSYFDLWAANQVILSEAGVQNVEIAGICTCCNLEDWYSHRGERGRTGRFGAIIGMYG